MVSKNYKLGGGTPNWMSGRAHNITFIVTEGCNLRCKYCYQVHKNGENRMDFETAKKSVDYILDNREIFSAPGVVWDFIGGEPLLEIELMDQITDYIRLQTYKRDHEWFAMNRINFTTNGVSYDDPRVRKFIAKNKTKCGATVTIDGTKNKHDLQRIYPNGKGSYDDVVKNIPLWLADFPYAATKVTFGSDDLKYLKESIIHLWKLGIKDVPANVVFEDVWKENDDLIFEEQLKQLADYIIENKLWNEYNTTLFEDFIGRPVSEENKNRNRCGAGMMLAVDGRGNFYPCLRYSAYSLENKNGYVIGNVEEGLDFDKIRPFVGLSLLTQSDVECADCEIADGCSWCQGHCYDETNCETNYKRVKYICKMHKARYRANEYYWGRLRDEYNIKRPLAVTKSKFLYFIMDDNCVEHCNYESSDNENFMREDVLKDGLKFAEENYFTPVILNSKNENNFYDINKYSYYERIEIYSSYNKNVNNNHQKFQVITPETIANITKQDSCILNINVDDIQYLYKYSKTLFEYCNRINLNIKYTDRNFPVEKYKEELAKISDYIFDLYKETGQVKEMNKITDDLFNSKKDCCNAGEKSYALSPDGKIYPCAKFYFEDKESYIGDLKTGIYKNENKLFELDKAPICKECDVNHCDRCVFLNKKFTNEYNTPSYIQCKISLIEKEITYNLYERMKELDKNFIESKINNNFDDPISTFLRDKPYQPYDVEMYKKHM
ncbi:MAG: radical SAM peptide maturase, CXXX-repeat target family [Clostridium botulinum]|nr:radical SAM peptide maturase, CXXX-repeat target family [Clostridium botulinum]